MKNKAFTLAEVMIVLTVIGIITSILLPTAFQASPDENVMKFKKGYSTLGQVIRELVTSDKYYQSGDLGVKPNKEWVDDTNYFLNTFADVVNIKKIETPEQKSATYDPLVNFSHQTDGVKSKIETVCKEKQSNVDSYVITSDNIYFYEASNLNTFGSNSPWIHDYRNPYYAKTDDKVKEAECAGKPTTEEQYQCFKDHFKDGIYFVYKIFCMDVDGINKGEDPFAFGIRVDGKIYTGQRADEWITKSVQKEE